MKKGMSIDDTPYFSLLFPDKRTDLIHALLRLIIAQLEPWLQQLTIRRIAGDAQIFMRPQDECLSLFLQLLDLSPLFLITDVTLAQVFFYLFVSRIKQSSCQFGAGLRT